MLGLGRRMWPELGQLRREMDRLFNTLGDPWGAPLARTSSFPAVNVWEDGDRLCLEAEIPGVEPDDLDLQVVADELTIKGHLGPLEERNLTYHRQERGTGDFTRLVRLPVEIDADKVGAVLKDGVLTLTLPKAEVARPRKITVKT